MAKFGDWLGRMSGWLLAVVVVSLIPFAFTLSWVWVVEGRWAGLDSAIGGGQLLPTCVVLVASGVPALDAAETRILGKQYNIMQNVAVVGIIIMALLYGGVTSTLLTEGSVSGEMQDRIVFISMCALFLSVVIAAIPIALEYDEGISLARF